MEEAWAEGDLGEHGEVTGGRIRGGREGRRKGGVEDGEISTEVFTLQYLNILYHVMQPLTQYAHLE